LKEIKNNTNKNGWVIMKAVMKFKKVLKEKRQFYQNLSGNFVPIIPTIKETAS